MANYPIPYQTSYGYNGGIGQQMFPQYQAQPQMSGAVQTQHGPGLIWVDGEVGAKAFQMPSGWPANQPIALWDTNDTVIYLKSINQMGMPNPLQKAHYSLEERKSGSPMRSGDGDASTGEFVRKEDMERMKQELMEVINSVSTGATRGRPVKGES